MRVSTTSTDATPADERRASGVALADACADHAAALSRESENPLMHYRLADEHRRSGNVDAFHRTVEMALVLPHVTAEERYARACAKLTLGDWSGWGDHEVRLAVPFFDSQLGTRARQIAWTHLAWDGIEDLSGKTLLILHEYGAGDAIQMLRFVPMVAARVGAVIMVVMPRLVPLVHHNYGHMVGITMDGLDRPITYDRYAWSMSLPAVIGHLPPFVPLTVPRQRPWLPPRHASRRAGLCWAGRAEHCRDHERSMPIAALAPLLARSDVEWYSVQVGPRAADAAHYASLRQPPRPLHTFGDTGAFLMDLDFVVTVDTAVAHLAGSLAIPTYLLLPCAGEWRWGLGDTTPWYPTIRLLRQQTAGDWGSVVDSLMHLL